MSRFTIALLSLAAAATAGSAQLLSGPPGANPPPPPTPPPAASPAVVKPAPPAFPPPTPAPAPAVAVAPAAPVAPANALQFDSESKEYTAKVGEASAPFTFNVTNTWDKDVQINSLRTSCGCTVAQLPSQPYTLHPGSNVPINVTVDLRGKMGAITKSVSVDSSAGFKSLLVRINIPQPATTTPAPGSPVIATGQMNDRAKNIQTALVDRQAVFKGQCTECHVQKGIGKLGKELFEADCAVCHDTPHRAAMVPDLKVPRTHRDLAFWKTWVEEGKAGTLMPGFAQAHGGPLTAEQVDSLVTYLFNTFPKEPPTSTPTVQQAQAHVAPATIIPPQPAPVKN